LPSDSFVWVGGFCYVGSVGHGVMTDV